MQYAEKRHEIKTGDVLAWSSNCIQCKIVRAWTGETYSHVGIAWVIAGRVLILEAVTSGIRIFPLSKELPSYWIPIPPELKIDINVLIETALSHMGEPYSRWQAIRAGFGLKTSGTSWQCASFTMKCLAAAGLVIDCDETPGKLIEKLQELGSFVEILKDNNL
jgi:hypothetical protein